jgi:DNA-binding transcriptional regulator YdaS (Cro superfamily)
MDSISKAIECTGGVANLALAIGVSKQSIYFWQSGKRGIPAGVCPDIERVTNGAVRCEHLRPDVDWGFLRNTACACEHKEVA